jgi:hypothetical protein
MPNFSGHLHREKQTKMEGEREIVVGERGIKGSERGIKGLERGIKGSEREVVHFLQKKFAAVPSVRPAREHAEFFWASKQQRLVREKGSERGKKGSERGRERDKGIGEREREG